VSKPKKPWRPSSEKLWPVGMLPNGKLNVVNPEADVEADDAEIDKETLLTWGDDMNDALRGDRRNLLARLRYGNAVTLPPTLPRWSRGCSTIRRGKKAGDQSCRRNSRS
jgi:hypothetical protein